MGDMIVSFKKYMSDSGYYIKMELDTFEEMVDDAYGFSLTVNGSKNKIYYIFSDQYRIAISSKIAIILEELGIEDLTSKLDSRLDAFTIPLDGCSDTELYELLAELDDSESVDTYIKDTLLANIDDL